MVIYLLLSFCLPAIEKWMDVWKKWYRYGIGKDYIIPYHMKRRNCFNCINAVMGTAYVSYLTSESYKLQYTQYVEMRVLIFYPFFSLF